MRADYEWQVLRVNLRKTVDDFRPQIVHLIGHGKFVDGKAKIDLVLRGGNADPVDAETFAGLISHNDLKLVFLQACETALVDPFMAASGIARSLANKTIPAIIAISDQIEKQIASEFACAFYESLATTGSIDGAVSKGRNAIGTLSNASQQVAFGVPVLYLDSQSGMLSLTDVAGGPTNTVTEAGAPRADRCPRCFGVTSWGTARSAP